MLFAQGKKRLTVRKEKDESFRQKFGSLMEEKR